MLLLRRKKNRHSHPAPRTRAAPAPSPSPEESVRTGMILPYAGSTAPEGYLECDGSAVSRVDYAALFTVIGTAYGAGDGSTTFNLPDFRGRTLLGAGMGSGLSARNRGDTGGVERVSLIVDEMPAHGHGYNLPSGVAYTSLPITTGMDGSAVSDPTLSSSSDTTGSNGSGLAHENMIPFGVVRWIVKA